MSDQYTAGATRTTAERRLTADDGTVTVRKLVSKGERLGIDTGEHGIKLDALLLEALSWQRDLEAIDDLLGGWAFATDPVAAAAGEDAEIESAGEEISISSEYSHVLVRDVQTPNGPGLEMTTPNRGTALTLGVQALSALAAVEDTYVFSVWFETPFGPEDTALEGPL
ncbi:hypothetical protein [Halorientalis marina]|uniref:hypothetical protein n=1 Tax=Halorientalis marina TaxID=2931976 RepID=UPI001FF33FF1|nr:hypothetical protein [Halorientalis marina]